MTVKVGNAEFTVDGYYNTSQTIHNLADKCYQQGRAEVLKDLWNMAISKYDEILSLEELAECIDKLKEKTK